MNLIDIHLHPHDPESIVTICHNQQIVYQGTAVDQISLKIQDMLSTNQLTIQLDRGWARLHSVQMFHMGAEFIKNQGHSVAPSGQHVVTDRIVKNVIWALEYQYPVFSWLMPRTFHSWHYRFD